MGKFWVFRFNVKTGKRYKKKSKKTKSKKDTGAELYARALARMKKQSLQSGSGMEEDNKNCKEKFCKQKIFSDKDWRNEALRIKKEAREKGITNFEFTPEYEEITKCRSQLDGVFPLQSECKCENCPKTNTNKRQRCSKGYKKNKKTGMCEPKNTTSQPKTSSQKQNTTTRKRCPNGYKKNKKTGMCEAKI